MFKGFQQVEYPDYEVVCPQSHFSIKLRSLTVNEEEKLKGSLLTPLQITDHLNKCIFNCVTSLPEDIENYESFLKKITLKDRDALLYGLYHVSYEEIRNYNVTCSIPTCGHQWPITVNASDTFNYNIYPQDKKSKGSNDIFSKRYKVNLEIFKNVSAIIKQPTLNDELDSYKQLGSRPGSSNDLILNILPIESFEEDIQEQTEPAIYSEKQDILDAYKSLPARDKKIINKKYYDEFGQYGIELKVNSVCPKCGNQEIKNVDLVENFFSMVYAG